MQNLSRSSKIPLYFQLYEILHLNIINGVWKPDDLMPTEAELIEKYGLSRATVRQAFDMLVNQGWVYRRQGQGTFVSRPTFEQNLNRIISFWEDMHLRGLKPGTRVLSSELVPASDEMVENLQVDAGEELASLVRLRLADDEPLSVEHSLLVHRYCPGILEENYANNSLRKMLADKYNLHLVHATQKIRAVSASKNMAKQLGVDVNAPLLHIERVSFNDQGIPIEYLRIHLRGDRYTFYAELRD